MKKFIFPFGFLFVIALAATVYSQLNPSYTATFGYGSTAASRHGAPYAAKFKAEQFSYKNNTFYFPPDEKPTCDLLAILPKNKASPPTWAPS
jgi:hypothetical protein